MARSVGVRHEWHSRTEGICRTRCSVDLHGVVFVRDEWEHGQIEEISQHRKVKGNGGALACLGVSAPYQGYTG